MDAESRRRRWESSISRREQRWSMSSSRLEEIVAALIKPVSHYAQSFDRDDSGLLEQYITEAGLRGLEAVEAGLELPPPNYAELGLIIQSFATNYCKKVDHLCRLVSDFRQSLHDEHAPARSGDEEAAAAGAGAVAGRAAAGRRSRRATPGADVPFGGISLVPSAAARRAASPPPGPPPTLPRGYAELQPRAPVADRALLDYAGEPIGLLDEFRVTWRLSEGFLVEELESGAAGGSGCGDDELRPLSLVELQEACARAASSPSPSPYPFPSPTSSRAPHSPFPPSSPPSPSALLVDTSTPLPTTPPPAAMRRKRRSEVRIEDLFAGPCNINIDEEVRERLSRPQEFSVSERWIRRVVRHRRDEILRARRAASPPAREFRGFDMAWNDIGGFGGWTAGEAAAARGALRDQAEEQAAELAAEQAGAQASGQAGGRDSDDDGFHERSSSLTDTRYSADHSYQISEEVDSGADTGTCREGMGGAGPPLDLRALARDVRRALPAPPAAVPWRRLLARTQRTQPQPARVLLDILCKATRGEVEIEPGPPLSVGQFSVRSVSAATPESPASPAASPPPEEEEWPALLASVPPSSPAPAPPSSAALAPPSSPAAEPPKD